MSGNMYGDITSFELKNLIDDANSDIILIDVREDYEFESAHIKDSILVPLLLFKNKIESVVLDKNKQVVLICRSGARSSVACDIMVKLEYKNVFNLVGGILDYGSKFDLVR
jgi:phage shock protein E